MGRRTEVIKCREEGGREFWERELKLMVVGVMLGKPRNLKQWKLPGSHESDPS